MPFRSALCRGPPSTAWSASVFRVAASGSLVGLDGLRQGRVEDSVPAAAFPSQLSSCVVRRGLRLGRVGVDPLVDLDRALQDGLDDLRVLLEELPRHDDVRDHELLVGPQGLLVEQCLGAASSDQLGRGRLRHPGAVDRAGLEQVRVILLSVRTMSTSAPPVRLHLQPVVQQPACAARRPACRPAAGWRASCP